MVTPATVMGFITPAVSAWLSDQLPKSGLSKEENERRLRNLAIAVIAGFGLAAIVNQVMGVQAGGEQMKLSIQQPIETEISFI